MSNIAGMRLYISSSMYNEDLCTCLCVHIKYIYFCGRISAHKGEI